MDRKIPFLNMFSQYQPPEHLETVLSQAAVTAADIDPENRSVRLTVHSDRYIEEKDRSSVAADLMELYSLKICDLQLTYPRDMLQQMPPEFFMGLFMAENSMARASLSGANYRWEGNCLHVELLSNGKDELVKAIPAVTYQIAQMFDTPVTITIHSGEHLSGQALFDAMEKMRGQMILDLPKVNFDHDQKDQKKEVPGAFYGRPFKGKAIPMQEVSLDLGSVIVEGKVFSVEHKELKKRNAVIINFDMTDHHGSVRVNRFMEQEEAKTILEKVKVGSVLRVQGRMTVNKFDNETVLQPTAIMPGEMPKRQDTAQGGKRVELHMHTVMSNMDALTKTADAIKQAAAWGHRAIAITDHGCCQSFTDALHCVEDWKGAPKVAGTDETIKILYGCEGYYVNDVDDVVAVSGDRDMPLTDSYVAFDLETTGLNSQTDEIIEIGAVLMQDGKEIDRFQTFVDPHRKLERITTELTGITNAMLKGAPSIEEVLPKFLEFVGDRVLVAHNADFDTGFVRHACAKLGLSYGFTSVDTLVLSQVLMTNLKQHKLNLVADALNLPEFNHHRAADDAVTCGLIMARFAQMLGEKGIHTLADVNGFVSSVRGPHRRESGKWRKTRWVCGICTTC